MARPGLHIRVSSGSGNSHFNQGNNSHSRSDSSTSPNRHRQSEPVARYFSEASPSSGSQSQDPPVWPRKIPEHEEKEVYEPSLDPSEGPTLPRKDTPKSGQYQWRRHTEVPRHLQERHRLTVISAASGPSHSNPFASRPVTAKTNSGDSQPQIVPVETALQNGWVPQWLRVQILSCFTILFALGLVAAELVNKYVDGRLESNFVGVWTFGPVVGMYTACYHFCVGRGFDV